MTQIQISNKLKQTKFENKIINQSSNMSIKIRSFIMGEKVPNCCSGQLPRNF